MKIALLNDTHFGARNDSLIFDDYFHKFYDDIFFPYLKEHNIKTLIHLGDIVDRRKFINYRIAHNFRHKFLQRLWAEKIDTHIIIGNHDIYFRNTNKVNAVQELCTTHDGLNEPWIYEEAKVVDFDGLKILMLPWINPENEAESLETCKTAEADICMGHLDLNGFRMMDSMVQTHGYDKSIVQRFERTYSGHFHHKNDDGQIFYLGSQYEMTWSDYNNQKGFHILDTETRELTRVPNPIRIHKKLVYNDKEEDYSKLDLEHFKDCFVKVFITNKTNEEMFSNLIDRLHTTIDTHEINIIEDLSPDVTASVKDNILEQGEDTITFLGNYIEQIDSDLDKNKLKEVMKDLYTEASER
jgi:hypothetical protein